MSLEIALGNMDFFEGTKYLFCLWLGRFQFIFMGRAWWSRIVQLMVASREEQLTSWAERKQSRAVTGRGQAGYKPPRAHLTYFLQLGPTFHNPTTSQF
jgi:hypothetical protein